MSAPIKDATHMWSQDVFETHRNSMTDFVKTNIVPLLDSSDCRRILIRAPVKSGKREMVEYMAIRDLDNPNRLHAFVSAFHRVADDHQRRELSLHNTRIFSLTTRDVVSECQTWMTESITAGKQIVLHMDEADFGTGHGQVLSRVYQQIRAHPSIKLVFYTATPQELLFSGEVCDTQYDDMITDICEGEWINYIPASGFCGPSYFLDYDLVENATPFFHKLPSTSIQLSSQGRSLMTDFTNSLSTNPDRNILVLRLSYSDPNLRSMQRVDNKAIYHFLDQWTLLPELRGAVVYADKTDRIRAQHYPNVRTEKIQWSNPNYWDSKPRGVPLIFVIDQTSTRSTEWACHDRIYALHDYRNTVTFSVASQAQERVNHYTSRYDGFQSIRVFGHRKTFELSAGRITYEEYMHNEWTMRKLSAQTALSMGLVREYYRIFATYNNEPHPNYSYPIPKTDAIRILQEFGSYAKVAVSPRVRGTIEIQSVCESRFYACSPTTFQQVKTTLSQDFPNHNFQNPFSRSQSHGLEEGKFKGYCGTWKVLDYDSDIKTRPAWGVTDTTPRLTICYEQGVLGVAVRWDTGMKQQRNTLRSFSSMYIV